MRVFQCFLFVQKRSYICYNIICMTVPLILQFLSGHREFPKSRLCSMISSCQFIVTDVLLLYCYLFIYYIGLGIYLIIKEVSFCNTWKSEDFTKEFVARLLDSGRNSNPVRIVKEEQALDEPLLENTMHFFSHFWFTYKERN